MESNRMSQGILLSGNYVEYDLYIVFTFLNNNMSRTLLV